MHNKSRLTDKIFSHIDSAIGDMDNYSWYTSEIMELIKKGADLSITRNTMTPVYYAAYNHLWNIVRTIVLSYTTPPGDVWQYDHTLRLVARFGPPDLAQKLINSGAKQRVYSDYKKNNGKIIRRDSLHWAMHRHHMEMVEILAPTADLSFKNHHGETHMQMAARKQLWKEMIIIARSQKSQDSFGYDEALLQAVYHKKENVVLDLLKSGAPQTQSHLKKRKEQKLFCMHRAIKNDTLPILQFLIQFNGNMNQTNGLHNSIGLIPLHYAFQLRRWHCVKYLLQSGTVVFNHDARISLDIALYSRKFDLIDALIRATSTPAITTTKDDGNTILHNIALNWMHLGVFAEEVLTLMLSNQQDHQVLNHDKKTPIAIASELALQTKNKFNHWEFVKIILTFKRISPKECIPVLHHAILDQDFIMVPLLLKLNTPCNVLDQDGNNIALLHAAKMQNAEILFFLLEKGADITAINRHGVSMRQMIIEYGGANGVKALQDFQEKVRSAPSVTASNQGFFHAAPVIPDRQIALDAEFVVKNKLQKDST